MADIEYKWVVFELSEEVFKNPYKGFTSFNRFRGEDMFPETGTKDGWIKERYPVHDFVKDYGSSEGFYPDCEIAYLRILWKDFEPVEGMYNYALLDEIFSKAEAHKQSVILRLMPHTAREEEDVPEWLKEQIECPERPNEKRIKDSPKDVLFLQKFAKCIRKIGEKYDQNPLFLAIDVSLPGAWGEGSDWDKYPKEDIYELIDAYTESFKETCILGQSIAPELVNYANETHPVGMRADGLGSPHHMWFWYPQRFVDIKDVWKRAPISFESFWYLNEWKNQGWDIDEIIEQSLRWHVSSVNGKSSGIPVEWKSKIDEWTKRMGYRFAVRSIEYYSKMYAGTDNNVSVLIVNRGVAPIYKKIPFKLTMIGENFSWDINHDVDITKWMPGDNIEYINLNIPKDIPKGNYKLCCSIGGGDYPVVEMAMKTEKLGSSYCIAEIEII